MNTLVEIAASSLIKPNTVKVSVIKREDAGPGCRWVNIRCHSADTCIEVARIIKGRFGLYDLKQDMEPNFRTKEEVDPTYIENKLPYHLVDINNYTGHEWILEQMRITKEAFQVALMEQENK